MRAYRSLFNPLVLLLALAATRAAVGADVNLAWDPSGDLSVVSYKVYYGTASRAYNSSLTVGVATSCTIRDLGPGTYYFAVTALSASGLESGFSNEVSTLIAGLPLSIVAVRDPSWIDSTRVVIAWMTNRASDSRVEYGIASAAENSILPNEPDPLTAHAVLLDGLIPGKTYHYRVKSADSSGAVTVSSDLVFQTPAAGAIVSRTLSYAARMTGGAAEADAEYAGLSIVNLGDEDAAILLWARDESGSPIRAAGIPNPAVRILKSQEQLSAVVNQLFGPELARYPKPVWISIESSSRKLAELSTSFDSGMKMMDAAVAPGPEQTSFVLEEGGSGDFTRIELANPGAEPASVTLELIQPDGQVRGVETRILGSHGAARWHLLSDLFPGIAPSAGDFIRGRSDQGVVVQETWGKPGAWIAELTGASTVDSKLYAPHYVQNRAYYSAVTVANRSNGPGYVSLRLIGNDGAQIGKTRTEPVPAGGKIRIDDPEYFAAEAQGTLEIWSADLQLSGHVTYSDPGRNRFAAALPLISALRSSVIFAHVASDETYFTGIAVFNPGSLPAKVKFQVFDTAGDLAGSLESTILSGARMSGLLTQLFPGLTGRALHSGHLVLTSDVPVASGVLFGSHGLSCLSAVPGQEIP